MRTELMLIAAAALSPATEGREQSRPDVLQAAVACHAISDAAERLACYDKAVAALDAAERTQKVVVLDRAQIQETKRSLFGFSLPKIKLFTGGKDDGEAGSKNRPAEETELQATVASTGRDADGRLTFAIDTGAHWRQIDDRPSSRVKPGMAVKIHRASLGSYFASFTGSVPIRVIRVS